MCTSHNNKNCSSLRFFCVAAIRSYGSYSKRNNGNKLICKMGNCNEGINVLCTQPTTTCHNKKAIIISVFYLLDEGTRKHSQ